MSTTDRALIAAALLAASACLLSLALDWPALRLASKWLPAALLGVLVARHGGGRLLVTALLLCALGDLVLEGMYLSPTGASLFFRVGLGLFLLAHLALIIAMLDRPARWRPLPLLLITAYGLGLFSWLQPQLGTQQGAVAIYTLTICAMLARAVCLLPPGHWPAWRRQATLIGALCFAASDSLLAINRFALPFDAARPLILLSYWAGLCGLSLGLLPARSSPRDRAANPAS